MKTRKLSILTALAGLTLVTLAPAGIATAARTPGAVIRSLAPGIYPSVQGRFTRLAATSAHDVWAVGLTSGPALLWHWNGSTWVEYPFSQNFYFLGVAAQSATDAWAVGGTYWFEPTETVTYHWNGKSWSPVPAPTPGGSAYLNAVTATSPTNAWAVGAIGGGPGTTGFDVPLIEHWNGKVWRQQSFNLPKNSGVFNGVVATSASNAWAVGATTNGGPSGALIEHWNGKRWRRVWPGTANGRGLLQAVTATGPDDVWAAGFNNNTSTAKSLILHFNGKRWSPVPSPNPTGSTDLWDISASSPGNAWAVGYTNLSCPCATAAFHWNGRTWTTVPTPDPTDGFLDALLGVVAITRHDAWAVGTTDWSSTIIEHWNGKSWRT